VVMKSLDEALAVLRERSGDMGAIPDAALRWFRREVEHLRSFQNDQPCDHGQSEEDLGVFLAV
jgi:hypothetical protein